VSGQHETDGGAESADDLFREEACGSIRWCVHQCVQSKTGGADAPDAAALVVPQALRVGEAEISTQIGWQISIEWTVREGAYEGSLLWENGIEHLQDLMLGKLCAEGIVHPGGLGERGIEKGTHVPNAWAVSGVVDDGVGKEDECWVVWRPVFQWRRRGRGSVVVRPGNPFVTFWEFVVGSGKVGLSRDR
jgi:hypothetical protein